MTSTRVLNPKKASKGRYSGMQAGREHVRKIIHRNRSSESLYIYCPTSLTAGSTRKITAQCRITLQFYEHLLKTEHPNSCSQRILRTENATRANISNLEIKIVTQWKKLPRLSSQMTPCCNRSINLNGICNVSLLNCCNLLSRIQSLGAGTGTVQYCMTAVKLEFITYCIKPLLGVFITAITNPSAHQ